MQINQRNPDQLMQNIMTILQKNARMQKKCDHLDNNHCFHSQKNKIKNLIEQKQSITFVLPAFPAKSPNFEKTHGILPDLGEQLSLRFLNDVCRQIQTIYSYGAQIIICADGRVFNDLVMVSDSHVNSYSNEIKKIINTNKLNYLSTFSLDDCYSHLDYSEMREQLLNKYSESLTAIKNLVKTDEESKLLFNGIHRFIFEDQLVHFPSLSRNQIRQQAKEMTYHVIQRSNAWGNLLKAKFPEAIRLSIHPQHCNSEKFGIMLLQSNDVWSTPWHRVVLEQKNQYQLIKRKEAEMLNAIPIFVEDQFSHYCIEN